MAIALSFCHQSAGDRSSLIQCKELQYSAMCDTELLKDLSNHRTTSKVFDRVLSTRAQWATTDIVLQDSMQDPHPPLSRPSIKEGAVPSSNLMYIYINILIY